MASVKASLIITLKANDVVVAELEDAALWQRILAAINMGDSGALALEPSKPGKNVVAEMPVEKNGAHDSGSGRKDWSAWAEQAK
ncbi:MAG TPA: hypothetical protein VGS02_09475 [Acidobacteriaceae bacterium]|nr:hypothetical protein [Acidobacteriaceae bacterium]